MQSNGFENEKRAAQIIKDVLYITVASVSPEGKPWNTPVYSAFDSDLNFYWTSAKDSVHSNNIRHNPDVFFAIYDSSVAEGSGAGVYLEARAEELNVREEILVARKFTQARKGKSPDDADDFMGEAHRRVYRATVTHGWINEAETLESGWRDYRTAIDLRRVRGML